MPSAIARPLEEVSEPRSELCSLDFSWFTVPDQANAIYLELRQRGFQAWVSKVQETATCNVCLTCVDSSLKKYDNRADDLTKEG